MKNLLLEQFSKKIDNLILINKIREAYHYTNINKINHINNITYINDKENYDSLLQRFNFLSVEKLPYLITLNGIIISSSENITLIPQLNNFQIDTDFLIAQNILTQEKCSFTIFNKETKKEEHIYWVNIINKPMVVQCEVENINHITKHNIFLNSVNYNFIMNCKQNNHLLKLNDIIETYGTSDLQLHINNLFVLNSSLIYNYIDFNYKNNSFIKNNFEFQLNQELKLNIHHNTYTYEEKTKDYFYNIEHNYKNTESMINCTNLNYGNSICNLTTKINSLALNSTAKQNNQNILLGKKAKSFSQPKLIVENPEVNCSHGCTSAKLPKDIIDYLTIRGISRENINMIVIQSHIEQFLENVPTIYHSFLLTTLLPMEKINE